MKNLTEEQRQSILKTQKVLMAIHKKVDVFFNVTQYLNLELIKEYGKTVDNKTNYVLTEKGNRILNLVI